MNRGSCVDGRAAARRWSRVRRGLRREGGLDHGEPRARVRRRSCSISSPTPTTSASTRRSPTATSRRPGWTSTTATPSDPSAPLKLLAAGKADLAISYEPELLLARDQGAEARLGRRDRPEAADLDHRARQPRARRRPTSHGKKVGNGGHPVPVGLPARRSSRCRRRPEPSTRSTSASTSSRPCCPAVDATLGGFWNYEGVQLRQRKKASRTIIPVDKAGVPTYNELIVVARKQDLADDGGKVRRFMRALARGLPGRARRSRQGRRPAREGQPRPRARAPAGQRQGDDPRVLPGEREAPFGFRIRAPGRPTAAGCSTTS